MPRALLTAGVLLAVVAVALLVGCPPSTPTGEPAPPASTSGPGASPEPSGAVNAAASSASNVEAEASDVKTLAETKCGKCHNFAKAIEDKHDAAEWGKVVRDMAAKKAGWISDAEAAQITSYLSTNYGK
jgi:cytochrome c5